MMKGKNVKDFFHLGNLAKELCEMFGGKGGGSDRHGEGSIPCPDENDYNRLERSVKQEIDRRLQEYESSFQGVTP